jgi:hypothetical protein
MGDELGQVSSLLMFSFNFGCCSISLTLQTVVNPKMNRGGVFKLKLCLITSFAVQLFQLKVYKFYIKIAVLLLIKSLHKSVDK